MSLAYPPLVEPESEKSLGSASDFARSAFTAKKLRFWGLKSAVSLLDQGLTSGAGFLVNLLLARWMAPPAYGAFAVAFATFLFVAGFHNVLLIEPMTVLGPSTHAENLPSYFRQQIKLHVILVGGLALMTLFAGVATAYIMPGNALIGALLGAGIALPFLLLLWLVRRICYVARAPALAITGSGTYAFFAVAGLLTLRQISQLNSFDVFLLLGAGSAFASTLLLWRLGLLKRSLCTVPRPSPRAVLRENWVYGRWLTGSTILYAVSNQVQIFIAAGILGLGSAGILRAMQLPALVATQVVAGTGPLILPAFAHEYGRGFIERVRQKATLISLTLGISALAFTALLALGAHRVEHLLFGGRYVNFAILMPLLALVPTASGFAHGFSMALRASHRPHFDLIASGIAAPIGMVSAVFLTHAWGLSGTAVSMVLSYTAIAIATFVCYRRSSWVHDRSKVIRPDVDGKETGTE